MKEFKLETNSVDKTSPKEIKEEEYGKHQTKNIKDKKQIVVKSKTVLKYIVEKS